MMADLTALTRVAPVLSHYLNAAKLYGWDTRGHLRIWHRQAIYHALGGTVVHTDVPTYQYKPTTILRPPRRLHVLIPPAERTLGHRRRIALALLTVHHLVAAAQPRRALLLDDPHDPDALRWWRRVQRGVRTLESRAAGCVPPDDDRPVYVDPEEVGPWEDYLLVALSWAYVVILYDSDFVLDPLPPEQSDVDLGWLEKDLPLMAALGSPARVAFWEWWLTEAVPLAYLEVPDEPADARPDGA